ncbi:MAG: UPF0149 family protein [Thiobacillus sp.]
MSAASRKPLSDDEIAGYDDLLQDLGARLDRELSVEGIDGFTAALLVGPRRLMPDDYFPVLLGEGGLAALRDDAERARFVDCFERRRGELERALAAPVENLADPRALAPLILDWEAILADMPKAEADALRAEGVPGYGELWAAGVLQAVEHWEDDWELPPDSKDEQFVDACLDPFYTLAAPESEWTAEEKKLSRAEHVAQAIWSLYDLREFWLDRGIAPAAPIRKAPEPGRNDPCPCGSGKKYKKCCGADV